MWNDVLDLASDGRHLLHQRASPYPGSPWRQDMQFGTKPSRTFLLTRWLLSFLPNFTTANLPYTRLSLTSRLPARSLSDLPFLSSFAYFSCALLVAKDISGSTQWRERYRRYTHSTPSLSGRPRNRCMT